MPLDARRLARAADDQMIAAQKRAPEIDRRKRGRPRGSEAKLRRLSPVSGRPRGRRENAVGFGSGIDLHVVALCVAEALVEQPERAPKSGEAEVLTLRGI